MAELTDPATYRLEPGEAWRRLKLRTNNRRVLALVRALAAWRETTAQQRDLPRSRVLRDEQLLEIAAHAPHRAPTSWRSSRGLGKGFAEGTLRRRDPGAWSRACSPRPRATIPSPSRGASRRRASGRWSICCACC